MAGVLEPTEQQELLDLLGTVPGDVDFRAVPAVGTLARSERLLGLVRPYLTREPFPIRAIYFDRSSAENWIVSWHQDLTLALRARTGVPGFGPWSLKDGVPHVQPPVEFLEQMLTVRLHLDDADDSNGALRVLPGSHRLGRLSPGKIQELSAQKTDVLCTVGDGDAMLMRPLLLHASGPLDHYKASTRAAHRICGL